MPMAISLNEYRIVVFSEVSEMILSASNSGIRVLIIEDSCFVATAKSLIGGLFNFFPSIDLGFNIDGSNAGYKKIRIDSQKEYIL